MEGGHGQIFSRFPCRGAGPLLLVASAFRLEAFPWGSTVRAGFSLCFQGKMEVDPQVAWYVPSRQNAAVKTLNPQLVP